MRRAILSLPLLLLIPSAASAQEVRSGSPDVSSASSGEIIVRYRPNVDARRRGVIRGGARVRREAVLPLAGTELVDPAPTVDVARAIRALERNADVLYAEPNAARSALRAPNDEFFGLQWGLSNTGQRVLGVRGTVGADIDAPAAWDVTTGSSGIVVGVIDSGAETTHPDLAPNLWRNPGESGVGQTTNGLDDDDNGFVDDVNGWDFVDGDGRPLDADGHGTHVAGIVGASGDDGVGVTGVAWSSSLMTLRALGADGSGTVADAISAYAYASRAGARVVNLSFGGSARSRAEREALAAAGGVLFVAAAGNDGVDNDVAGSFPCGYDLANVICVAASDRNDALAPFSNRGVRTVDLAAPGVDIASTYLGRSHAYLSGTSMAAPFVTGAAALVLARAPGLTVGELRDVLLSSVDPVPGLEGVTVTGGRLNAARAVDAAGRSMSPASGGSPAGSAQPVPASADPQVATTLESPAPPATPVPVGTGLAALPAASLVGGPRAAAPDRSAPTLTLRSARSRRTSDLRSRGLRVTVRCSEACRVSVVMTLDTATRRRFGLRSRRLASARVTLARAGTRVLVLRPGATPRRRLRGYGRAALQATASDQAGNRRSAARTVLLRR